MIELPRYNYREVEEGAKEKCTNCKYGFFNSKLGICQLFLKDHMDYRITTGHVCDKWVGKE